MDNCEELIPEYLSEYILEKNVSQNISSCLMIFLASLLYLKKSGRGKTSVLNRADQEVSEQFKKYCLFDVQNRVETNSKFLKGQSHLSVKW